MTATAEDRSTARSDDDTRPARAAEAADDGAAAGGAGGALDNLLADAALGPVRQWFPGMAGIRTAGKLATRPQTVARRSLGLTREAVRIVAGRSEVSPPKKDRRFRDDAWEGNPFLHRLLQTYLATAGTLEDLLDDANLDWRDDRRMRYVLENVVSALAPSNAPVLNPTAVKAAIDTGGRNYLKGTQRLLQDMRKPPRIPKMVDTEAFEVGKDLALTPGSVVLRTDVFELIQYTPQTEKVREVPVLLVPPMINKFYIADIAPGRSMVEHFVGAGQQMFTISWRNPDEDQAEWSLDTYAGAVLEALAAVEEISGSSSTNLFGLCAGGIVSSVVLSHLAATGEQDRVASLTLGVTVLDQQRLGTVGSFVDKPTAALAAAESRRKGYLDGRALAGVFAWLRPDDLIWNYWINNYLLGKRPPAFDVLYWNADTTRMPAALHRDFLGLAVENALVEPGRARVLGTPVDLSRITVDTYNLAGIADHICPWENVYRSSKLFGKPPRFVLSTSGHIASLVNPPGNKKASFQVAQETPDDTDAWLEKATTHPGSWWPDWVEWVGERSGDEKPAPKRLGSKAHKPLDEAPGTYVFQA